jgi:apolipoprotein N-acyltransferase
MLSNQSKWLWLSLGALLIAAAHLRWGIGPLAWVAPVPFLWVLRRSEGWRARLAVVAALYAGFSLALLKITTAPLDPAFPFLFALPITLFHGAAYLLWDRIRRSSHESLAVLSFPALAVSAEYAQHRFTPFASWGAAAYTQLELLPLLQLASVFGIAGVGFLVYFFAAALESLFSHGRKALQPFVVACASVCAALVFGTLRLELARPGETVRVAAVGTDAAFSGWPLPAADERARIDDGLFARTHSAARAGAKLVAWTEAATIVLPEEERAFLARLADASERDAIELVAAYIVPSSDQRSFENKYAWLRPDGTLDHSYLKHEPVPGEPAIRGTSAPKTVDTAAGVATGALCYDYDFPALSLEHARLGIDLAVVPSSDWRGIDPLHTQMASLRAIEGGFSLLRSTRFGLSAGFDQYGRARAWESAFDTRARVLMASLPARRVGTLYSRIGDAFVLVCALFAAGAWLLGASARKRSPTRRGAATPASAADVVVGARARG